MISLLQKPYGKSGLFKVILVKTRKTCSPLEIFMVFSLMCGAPSASLVYNKVWI